MCVSDPGERWPMVDRSDATNLEQKRAFPNSFEKLNGANGMSDIEGKATRARASEAGQQTNFEH